MSKRTTWLIVGGVFLVVVIVGISMLLHMFSGSSVGTVQVGKPTESTSEVTQTVPVTTPYFTTTLPAGFVVKRQTSNPASSSLLQFAANTSSATDQAIAITVSTVPAGGIKEVGDYHLRQTQTASYAPFTPDALPAGAVAFKNISGPPGFTVFWPHANRYSEISLSTDGIASLEQLQVTFSQTVKAWQWQ